MSNTDAHMMRMQYSNQYPPPPPYPVKQEQDQAVVAPASRPQMPYGYHSQIAGMEAPRTITTSAGSMQHPMAFNMAARTLNNGMESPADLSKQSPMKASFPTPSATAVSDDLMIDDDPKSSDESRISNTSTSPDAHGSTLIPGTSSASPNGHNNYGISPPNGNILGVVYHAQPGASSIPNSHNVATASAANGRACPDPSMGVRPKRGYPKRVPDEEKDETYWIKRQKNNESAKRSRDTRAAKQKHVVEEAQKLAEKVAELQAELHMARTTIIQQQRSLHEHQRLLHENNIPIPKEEPNGNQMILPNGSATHPLDIKINPPTGAAMSLINGPSMAFSHGNPVFPMNAMPMQLPVIVQPNQNLGQQNAHQNSGQQNGPHHNPGQQNGPHHNPRQQNGPHHNPGQPNVHHQNAGQQNAYQNPPQQHAQ